MIVVTTPNGHIGHHVLDLLLDAGEQVRVVVRDASKLPENVRLNAGLAAIGRMCSCASS